MARILIVEDDEFSRDMVVAALRFDHHDVEFAGDGRSALQKLKFEEFDLVILDWQLPDTPGLQVCKTFRDADGTAPILFLTGKGDTNDKVAGLEAGADDYLTKPFQIDELLARVKALLRRAAPLSATGVLRNGDIELDVENHRVSKNGQEIRLIPKEFAILQILMRYPNKVFSAETIIDRVWDTAESPSPDVVRTHVKNLRKKFGDDELIETIHAVGYRLHQAKKSS